MAGKQLSKAARAIALHIQEAMDANDASNNTLRSMLSDAVQDCADAGQWCYLEDFIGDAESGEVVYCCGGDLKKAPYSVSSVGGKMAVEVDDENAVDVIRIVTYQEEADDEDHYTSMEAERLYKSKTDVPMYERFISKAERKSASAGSFAGKGKSFPILKPGDVKAAASSLGRAGSDNYDTGTIKKNIIRIAKAKGWASSLPKAWQDGGDDSKESADVEITSDLIPLREGAVGQDGTAYLKLIAPGWGSSGYYSPQVLKTDGPKVFKAGTKNYWNHQTDAEEAARPEGDLRDVASVLTEDAHYEEKGPAGPGLYAKAEVQPHFRGPVDSLAKHIGVSIRASGKAKEGKAEGRTGAIIEQLTSAKSVDYVTEPGAGGKILQLFEAARGRTSPQQESEMAMTAEQETALREAAEAGRAALAEVRKLREREALTDAAAEYFATVPTVKDAVKSRVKARIAERGVPKDAAGNVDVKALREAIEKETKDEVTYLESLVPTGRVSGMGAPVNQQPTAEELAESKARRESELKQYGATRGVMTRQGLKVLEGGMANFDPFYNSARLEKEAS